MASYYYGQKSETYLVILLLLLTQISIFSGEEVFFHNDPAVDVTLFETQNHVLWGPIEQPRGNGIYVFGFYHVADTTLVNTQINCPIVQHPVGACEMWTGAVSHTPGHCNVQPIPPLPGFWASPVKIRVRNGNVTLRARFGHYALFDPCFDVNPNASVATLRTYWRQLSANPDDPNHPDAVEIDGIPPEFEQPPDENPDPPPFEEPYTDECTFPDFWALEQVFKDQVEQRLPDLFNQTISGEVPTFTIPLPLEFMGLSSSESTFFISADLNGMGFPQTFVTKFNQFISGMRSVALLLVLLVLYNRVVDDLKRGST